MTLERLGVPSEDVLGTNYTVTSLTVSDYNPSIDGTVTLTVTVKDVYNAPVVGEEVTVTASDGDFTQLDGSTITAASSVTGTTNSSGQFILTYSCTEWGLITFSANNITIQIHVKGYRTLKNDSGITVRANQDTVECKIVISSTSFPTTFTQFTGQTVPTGYNPNGHVFALCYNNNNLVIGVLNDGKIVRRSMTGSSVSGAADCLITYSIR